MTPAAEAFAPVRAALELAGVPYAIGGSWASGAFGEPRMTRDIDVVADFTPENLERFFDALPDVYFVDPEDARKSLRLGRSFNAIYMPKAFKVDFFPARSSALGLEQLSRAVELSSAGISDVPVPFVSPEDVLLAKLHRYQLGGGVLELQWRDILGLVRARANTLDRLCLNDNAARLGVAALLDKALAER